MRIRILYFSVQYTDLLSLFFVITKCIFLFILFKNMYIINKILKTLSTIILQLWYSDHNWCFIILKTVICTLTWIDNYQVKNSIVVDISNQNKLNMFVLVVIYKYLCFAYKLTTVICINDFCSWKCVICGSLFLWKMLTVWI